MNNPYQQYQQNSIFTAPPEELTLMLYDGCIKFVNKAIYACTQKNVQGTNSALQRAQAIISELDGTLNDSVDVSKNLHALYDFMNRSLIDANFKKDVQLMKEVLNLLTDLRNTWKEAMVIARRVK